MTPDYPRDKLEKRDNPFDGMSPVGLTPKQRLRMYCYTGMFMVDAMILAVSVALASQFRFGTPFTPQGVNILLLLLPLYLVMGLYKHNYSSSLLLKGEDGAVRAVFSLFLASAAILFVSFGLHVEDRISRILFGMTVLVASVLLVAVRLAVQCGNGALGALLRHELLIRDGVGTPVAEGMVVVEAAELQLDPERCDPFSLDRLGRLVLPADRVVIACPPERRHAWAMALKGANVRAEIFSPELDSLEISGCGQYGGGTTLVVSCGPLAMHSRALKRALDCVLATGALIFLAPLMIVTAIAIRLESPGPILFVQPRLGRGNRLFNMYKFRSMRTELCDLEGRQSTQRDDRRVTRVGRIIRATSIDELPQILNVLKGDMSVVGPRPHALGSVAEEKLFWEVDGRYWRRHAIKPGITGLAQVRGFRGATHYQSDLVNRLRSDLDYLNEWSLRRDLLILLTTLKVVVHRNAY